MATRAPPRRVANAKAASAPPAFPPSGLTKAIEEASAELQSLTSTAQRKHRRAQQLQAAASPHKPAKPPPPVPTLTAEEEEALRAQEAAKAERRRVADLRRRVIAVYRRYAPDKQDKAAAQLEKHEGKEDKLLRALVGRYGPEPEP